MARRLAWLFMCALAAGCGSDGGGDGGSGEDRPIQLVNGVFYGATCDSDSDCGSQADACCKGGKCSPNGWCSPSCKETGECPAGFSCVDHDGTRCFVNCLSDLDCPSGFICEEKDNAKTCRYK